MREERSTTRLYEDLRDVPWARALTVLAQHQVDRSPDQRPGDPYEPIWARCSCGWVPEWEQNYLAVERHQLDQLRDAGLVLTLATAGESAKTNREKEDVHTSAESATDRAAEEARLDRPPAGGDDRPSPAETYDGPPLGTTGMPLESGWTYDQRTGERQWVACSPGAVMLELSDEFLRLRRLVDTNKMVAVTLCATSTPYLEFQIGFQRQEYLKRAARILGMTEIFTEEQKAKYGITKYVAQCTSEHGMTYEVRIFG